MSSNVIKRKVMNLRAKTISAGCSEAEAISAMELAARLMRAHQISEADLEFIRKRQKIAIAVPRWQRWLLASITKATNTHVISIRGDIKELEFSGREHEVMMALYLRDMLVRAVNTEIRKLKATSEYIRKRTVKTKTEMVSSFAAGLVSRLSESIFDLFAATMSASVKAVAQRQLEEAYPTAAFSRSSQFRLKNATAYFAGRSAGENIPVSHGVAGGKAFLKIGQVP